MQPLTRTPGFLEESPYIPGRPNWRRTISLQRASAQGLHRPAFGELKGFRPYLQSFGNEE